MKNSCGPEVAICCSPLVDRYLARQGAIAQTVDRNTILLHSRVSGMAPADRLVLLLHEWAHARQLARPGNDPVGALEDEAWEAAHAWAAGRPYRVRGRARGRLNALAIIQGAPKGHPAAPAWYKSNPLEPIGKGSKISVKDSTVIADMTLDGVMDEILRAKPTEVVLVCHGLADQLAIPLMSGAASGAEQRNMFPLSADSFLKKGETTPIISDKDVADQTRLSEDQVKAFRAKMNQVRGLKLKHVAFRSCDLGQSTDAMEAFRDFFGAESVSAPKLFDSYGQFQPVFGSDVKTFVAHKRRDGFRVWVDAKVAFGIKRTDSFIKYKIVCQAPDGEAFTTWLRDHVADRPGTDWVTVYHGMKDEKVADPEAPIVYFVRDAAFLANLAFFSG